LPISLLAAPGILPAPFVLLENTQLRVLTFWEITFPRGTKSHRNQFYEKNTGFGWKNVKKLFP
jgi:hypothetical protein